jgi:hypothetical protein
MIIYTNGDGEVNGIVFSYCIHTVGMEHIFTVRTLTDSYATPGIPELCIPPISRCIMSPQYIPEIGLLDLDFVHPIL